MPSNTVYVTDDPKYLKNKQDNAVRFVCMSDTHGATTFAFDIPDGDVFIHAGDLTRRGNIQEFRDTLAWIRKLTHPIKIVTGGNHDIILDEYFGYVEQKQTVLAMMEQAGIVYLEHEEYRLPDELGGLRLFVSPYAPIHLGGAFMPQDLSPIWKTIPEGLDVLVTHTPPQGYKDKIKWGGRHVGCPILREKIAAVQPRVCVFGHIHEDHGWCMSEDNKTLMVNACTCNHRYRANQLPVVFDLEYKKE
ncbi:Metallo-dependent phosphatase-like protein [Syncephalastrum racemosum]|uniref:Metallo-dependent phosphatase-like protein n=1 Tax=Syncephalastrum racemosum TaxID=13706 RepID=A0A1X2HUM7_SYNRA|nr:Metallo-dependent phosphatase-like protein [Syncephalastrum racemosum]